MEKTNEKKPSATITYYCYVCGQSTTHKLVRLTKTQEIYRCKGNGGKCNHEIQFTVR